ncbi:alkylated DNA repair protein [Stagonosporopsis vannaccii]|nr:alkylated DNA repair protein [Stagonosporopsis vannaccii]
MKICLAPGIRPIITSSSDDKLKKLKDTDSKIGVVNYKTQPDIVAEVLRLTEVKGVEVLNNIGVASIPNDLKMLRKRAVGLLSPASWMDLRVIMGGSRAGFEVLSAFSTDKGVHFDSLIDRTFSFYDAKAAFDYLASGVSEYRIIASRRWKNHFSAHFECKITIQLHSSHDCLLSFLVIYETAWNHSRIESVGQPCQSDTNNTSPPRCHFQAQIGNGLLNKTDRTRSGSVHHDTHATPPNFIQKEHWRYQSMRRAELESDPDIFDLSKRNEFTSEQKEIWRPAGFIPASRIESACQAYAGGRPLSDAIEDAPIFEHRDFPGLQVISRLLPPETQVLFTSCLMHRDLANPGHKINLQTDYEIRYPPRPTSEPRRFDNSFFLRDRSAAEDVLVPKSPDDQKPLNNEQFLYAKHATPFPGDLSKLVTGLFPHIQPESGVVLMYGAKDFMPVHRDVSEQCQRALASFSVGCDGIFIMAKGEDDGQGEQAPRTVAIRVRSGDCVHLTGDARWAWHAMARTIPSTCPSYLAHWPVGTPGATSAEERAYKKWRGYMGTKRINVSCRQVWD